MVILALCLVEDAAATLSAKGKVSIDRTVLLDALEQIGLANLFTLGHMSLNVLYR
jgi:hypothetical protein